MRPLREVESAVARFYSEEIFEDERTRLPVDSPVEFAITCRCLARWIVPGSLVAEVGVGGGEYTRFLAGRGCRIHAVDVAEPFLEALRARAATEGWAASLAGTHHRSATFLDVFEDSMFDAVLLLGPIYHLLDTESRRAAVGEAARILRPGGILLAAGLNRLCYLREQFRHNPDLVLARRESHDRHVEDALLDPGMAPTVGFAHLTSRDEFRALFEDRFDELALLATESFTGVWQAKLNQLPPEQAEAWLDLVERTASWPEAFGMADHYLFAGRKRYDLDEMRPAK